MDLKYLPKKIKIFKPNYDLINCQISPTIESEEKGSSSLTFNRKYLSKNTIKILLKDNKTEPSLFHKTAGEFNRNKNNNNITWIKNSCAGFLNEKFFSGNQRCLSSRLKKNNKNMKFRKTLLYNIHNQLSDKLTNTSYLPKSDKENKTNEVTNFNTNTNNMIKDFCITNNNFKKNVGINEQQTNETCDLNLSEQENQLNNINILNCQKRDDNKKPKLDKMIIRYKIKTKKYNTRIFNIEKKKLNELLQEVDINRRKNKLRTTIKAEPAPGLKTSIKTNSKNYEKKLEEIKPKNIDFHKQKSFNKTMKTFLYKEMRLSQIQDFKIKTTRKLEKCDISKFTKTEMQKNHIKYLILDKKETIIKNNIITRFNNNLFYKYGKIRLKLESKINNNIKVIYKKIAEGNKEQQINYKKFFIKKGINALKYANYFSNPENEIKLFLCKSNTNSVNLDTNKLQNIFNDSSYQTIKNYCLNRDSYNIYQKYLNSFSLILRNLSVDSFSYNNIYNFFQKNAKNFPKFKDLRDFSIYYALKYQLLDNSLMFSNNIIMDDNSSQNSEKYKNNKNGQNNKKKINFNIKKKNYHFLSDKIEKFNFTKKCIEMVVKVNKINDPEIQELLRSTTAFENREKMPEFPEVNFPKRIINLYTEENFTERKKTIFGTNIFDKFGNKITKIYNKNDLDANLDEINLLINKKYNQFLINYIINKNFDSLLFKIEKYYKYIDLNYKNEEGNTLLHLCIVNQIPINVIEFLISKGIDINCQNNNLDTPLHIACRNKSYSYINLLIKYRANEYILNNENKTCWEC